MPIYEVAVRYYTNNARETSAKYKPQFAEKTETKTEEEKEKAEGRNWITPHKAMALGLGGAAKINQYVGELTENTVTQRRTSVGLTMVGFGLYALSNPVMATVGLGLYVGNAGIQYAIRNYKENLTTSYMRELSGGTVKSGR